LAVQRAEHAEQRRQEADEALKKAEVLVEMVQLRIDEALTEFNELSEQVTHARAEKSKVEMELVKANALRKTRSLNALRLRKSLLQ